MSSNNGMILKTFLTAFIATMTLVTAAVPIQPELGLAGEKAGFRLIVKTDQATHHAGSSFHVATEFRNVGSGPLQVAVDHPEELFYHFNVVRMVNDNSSVQVELSPLGKERTWMGRSMGTRFRMLAQGEALESTFDVGAWYVMSPGTYKIACYVDMRSGKDPLPKLRYISNELTVTIVP